MITNVPGIRRGTLRTCQPFPWLATRCTSTEMAACFAVLAAVVISCVLGDHSEPHYGSGELDAANYAMEFYNRRSNCAYAYKVISIVSDAIQIYPPARVKYTMTVKVGQTVCRNNSNVNLDSCSFQNSTHLKTMTCHFVVLAVPHSKVPSHLLKDYCY